MKILIIGLPDHVTDEAVAKALAEFVKPLHLVDVEILAKVIPFGEIAPRSKKSKATPLMSKFERALLSVLNVAPNEATDSISFRSWFYSQVLKGVIARPILEILAFGPCSKYEVDLLQANRMQALPEYSKVAISMLAE